MTGQFEKEIESLICNALKKAEERAQTEENYLTREQVGKLLEVSIVTVDKWTSEGLLKGRFVIGGRVRYKSRELHASVQSLNSSNNAA